MSSISVQIGDLTMFQRDAIVNAAELLTSPLGAFYTGASFLIDGGATVVFFMEIWLWNSNDDGRSFVRLC